jgi:hypothetical protein
MVKYLIVSREQERQQITLCRTFMFSGSSSKEVQKKAKEDTDPDKKNKGISNIIQRKLETLRKRNATF